MNKESILSRKITRRDFARKARDTALATAFIATGIGTVAYVAIEANKEEETLFGKPVDGLQKREFLTAIFGDEEYIPLRKEPNLNDLVAVTRPNFRVDAQPVYGVTYTSNSQQGRIEKNNSYYGIWYRLDVVPIFKKAENGDFVPVGVKHGVYVSGNFLTEPPSESDNQADAH